MKVDRSVVVSGVLGATLIGIIIYMLRKRAKEDAAEDDEYEATAAGSDDQYQDQLRKGVGVEREHAATYAFIKRYYEQKDQWPDPDKVYAEIAKDHLAEMDDYYDRLAEMEAGAGVDADNNEGEIRLNYASPLSAAKAKVSLSKDKAMKLMEHAKGVPKPKGWDSFYNADLKPRMTKAMKALTVVGAVVSPVALAGLAGTKAAGLLAKSKRVPGRRRFNKFAGMDTKAISKINGITKEVMGRAITIMKIYMANDKDLDKTLADVKAKNYHATDSKVPKLNIDWDRVDEDKLFAAAMFIADDTANIGTTTGTAAASPTGVGAAIGGGVTAGVATVTVGDDIYALKLIADAIGPAIDVSN